jgi:ribosomal protein L29
MSKDELDKKLHDLKSELMKINAQISVGTTLKNTSQARDIKRTIAKIETHKKQSFQNEMKSLKVKKYKRL